MTLQSDKSLYGLTGWRTIGVVIVANCLFFALVLLAVGDPAVIVNRVRTAFETGELGISDYLPYDTHRGWHQYNDCNVLQMLSNPDPSRLKQALAPVIYKADPDFNRACPVLYALVMEGVSRESLLNFRYGRYWHGNNGLAYLALRIMELKYFRRVLSMLVWISILLLSLVTFRLGRSLRTTGLAIGLASALAWAVPYFSSGLTHGPGDALMLFALTGLAIYARQTTRIIYIVPFAAGLGAMVVFFEVLTGQLVVAGAWLASLTLAAGRDRQRPEDIHAPFVSLVTLIAFGFGAASTVILKQILAFLLAEPNTSAQFITQLRQYMRVPASNGVWPGIVLPYIKLIRQSHVLTYGNKSIGYALLIVTLLTWLAAVIRGWRMRKGAYGREILLLAALALIPFTWVLLWPNHTAIHAVFMVRMLVVPIALAPLAFFWPLRGEGEIDLVPFNSVKSAKGFLEKYHS